MSFTIAYRLSETFPTMLDGYYTVVKALECPLIPQWTDRRYVSSGCEYRRLLKIGAKV